MLSLWLPATHPRMSVTSFSHSAPRMSKSTSILNSYAFRIGDIVAGGGKTIAPTFLTAISRLSIRSAIRRSKADAFSAVSFFMMFVNSIPLKVEPRSAFTSEDSPTGQQQRNPSASLMQLFALALVISRSLERIESCSVSHKLFCDSQTDLCTTDQTQVSTTLFIRGFIEISSTIAG